MIIFKYFFYIVILLQMFVSCEYIENINQKYTGNIDYSLVDEYPIFSACSNLESMTMREICFEEAVHTIFKTNIDEHEFCSTTEIDKKAIISIEIDKKGSVSLHKIEMSDKTRQALPELEGIVLDAINTFPQLTPAKKKGVAVTSIFQIPISFDVEENPN